MPDLGFQIELGDRVDGLVRGHPFGYDGGTGVLLRPAGELTHGAPIHISGELRCHGCGESLPFQHTVHFGGGGLFGGPMVRCPRCGSQASLTESSHKERGVLWALLVASPFSEPASGPVAVLAFLTTEVRREASGPVLAEGRRGARPAPAENLAAGDLARALAAIPAAHRPALESLEADLAAMMWTEASRATEELEAHNRTRRSVWGGQAAVLPILRGAGGEVMGALLACVARDFSLRGARNVQVERIEGLAADDPAAAQLAGLPPDIRADFEQRAIQHHRHGGTGEPGGIALRKLVLTVHFQDTFGRHEILRIGEDAYLGMACTVESGAARPLEAPSQPVRPPTAGQARSGLHPLAIVAMVVGGAFALFIGALILVAYLLTPKPLPPEVLALARSFTVRLDDHPGTFHASRVKPGYLELAKVEVRLGRAFLPADFEAASPRVALLAANFHRDRFQASPGVLGSTIRIDGQPTRIVGVLSEQSSARSMASLWVPAQPEETPAERFEARWEDGAVSVAAERVRPGFFKAQGVVLRAGRLLQPSDFEASAAPVALISEGLSRARFPGVADPVGRRVSLDGQPTTIVGVLSDAPADQTGVQLWLPDRGQR